MGLFFGQRIYPIDKPQNCLYSTIATNTKCWYRVQARGETADGYPVGDSYLEARLSALRQMQNGDGGWGYFPNKQSWLEPTLYAALALHGEPEADRAWALVKPWQNPDGGFRPASDVEMSHAGTALGVTTAVARGESGEVMRKGVEWLVGTAGVESQMYKRVILKIGSAFGLVEDQRDFSMKGWPWKPETASWVEPTAHALVALKQSKIDSSFDNHALRERVRLGEGMLLDVRAKDGGWNYGNRTARGEDLRSYPETTAIALVGLQGRGDLGWSFDLAKKMLGETQSPLARAWLTIALRVHGVRVNGIAVAESTGEPSRDVLITALEALGAADGNYRFMKVAS
jgi:hypothetical protein